MHSNIQTSRPKNVLFKTLADEGLPAFRLMNFRDEMFNEKQMEGVLVVSFKLNYLPAVCGDYSFPGARLDAALKDLAETSVTSKNHLVLDFSSVTDINTESAGTIADVVFALKQVGLGAVSVNLSKQAAARPGAFGLLKDIPNFASIDEATRALNSYLSWK